MAQPAERYSMMRLTRAQARMRLEFLENYVQEKLSSDDLSVFCYMCKRAGAAYEEGHLFTTKIPAIDPYDLSKGLMMDAIEAVWVCPECVKRNS